MKRRWIFFMIKGLIYEEDRHHKPLGTWITKKQRCKSAKIWRNIREKYIIIDILTFLWEYFIKCRKDKIRSILNDVINNLNIIDLYLVYVNLILHKYIKNSVSCTLSLDVHRTFRKTGKKINITKFQKVEFFFVYVIQSYICTYVIFEIIFHYRLL